MHLTLEVFDLKVQNSPVGSPNGTVLPCHGPDLV
jgi:hypothetical protein